MRLAVIVAVMVTLAAPLSAPAQPAAARVGFLFPGPIPPRGPLHDALWRSVGDAGWVLGKNLAIEERGAQGRMERLPSLAAELVQAKVDVIIAVTTPPVVAAKQVTTTVPIVMVYAGDPVGDGLVADLARPEANVTGVAHFFSDMVDKTLQIVRELLPDAHRVAVVYPQHATIRRVIVATQPRARARGLELEAFEIDGRTPLDTAFAAIHAAKTDAVYVIGAAQMEERRAIALAMKYRIPTFHAARGPVEDGGLMAYWGDDLETWRSVGRYVGRILNGAKPRELPVEQPTRVGLAINMKTARELRLSIPPSLLLRADQIIE